jgi:hypothetical protein
MGERPRESGWKEMRNLLEFYEMAWSNEATLCASERAAILEARAALRSFREAMDDFKRSSADQTSAESGFFMAA